MDVSRQVGRHITAGLVLINGGRGNTSEFMVDGVTNTATFSEAVNSIAAVPSVDAVQELKVQTNSYSAEFGRSGGGVVNVVTKSGSNSFHVTVYEFLRDSKMDANNFFANRADRELTSFKRNQYGVSLGGPILRNKAFFFVNFEGLRERAASNFIATVPTVLQRRGDFSQSMQRVAGGCLPLQIFDAVTMRRNPNGTGFIRDAFAGNVMPASRFDRVGSGMVQYYPEPNTAGDPCSGVDNFVPAKSQGLSADQVDSKFDWAASSRNRFLRRYQLATAYRVAANHYGTLANLAFESVSDPSSGRRAETASRAALGPPFQQGFLDGADQLLVLKYPIRLAHPGLPQIAGLLSNQPISERILL